MSVQLLTEHHFELLSLKGGCKGSSESIHVKMPHCWKSHVAAQIVLDNKSMQPFGIKQNSSSEYEHVLYINGLDKQNF